MNCENDGPNDPTQSRPGSADETSLNDDWAKIIEETKSTLSGSNSLRGTDLIQQLELAALALQGNKKRRVSSQTVLGFLSSQTPSPEIKDED